MLVHKEPLSGTTASGVLTIATKKFSGVLLKLLMLNPATATTTYDVNIKDSDGHKVYEELGVQGQLLRELDTPSSGVHTVNITAASADEAFTGLLKIREN